MPVIKTFRAVNTLAIGVKAANAGELASHIVELKTQLIRNSESSRDKAEVLHIAVFCDGDWGQMQRELHRVVAEDAELARLTRGMRIDVTRHEGVSVCESLEEEGASGGLRVVSPDDSVKQHNVQSPPIRTEPRMWQMTAFQPRRPAHYEEFADVVSPFDPIWVRKDNWPPVGGTCKLSWDNGAYKEYDFNLSYSDLRDISWRVPVQLVCTNDRVVPQGYSTLRFSAPLFSGFRGVRTATRHIARLAILRIRHNITEELFNQTVAFTQPFLYRVDGGFGYGPWNRRDPLDIAPNDVIRTAVVLKLADFAGSETPNSWSSVGVTVGVGFE